jgi:DNA-binding NtrC family response regulator
MKPRLILLATQDRNLQALLSEALLGQGAIVLAARNAGEALELVCSRGREFDLAMIDFDDGCHGMTLVSALNTCQPALPVIVVISSDAYHAAAIAYANGAAVCLAKPVSAEELRIVIEEIAEPKLQLEAA